MTSLSINPIPQMTRQPVPYWHRYYSHDVVARAERLMQERTIRSRGIDLYTNIYQRPEADAPIFIWNHGGGGYSGMFVSLALAFYERGYTVVLADLQGHGRTGFGSSKGDFTIDGIAQNVVDVVRWTRQHFSGPIFMGGGSIGSGFTYQAVALGAEVNAVVTSQLYTFDDPNTALMLSRFAPLRRIPGLARGLQIATKPLARLLPKLRLPYLPMAHWDNMIDERDKAGGFVEKWKQDPYTPRTITLEALSSLQLSPPAVLLEHNTTPWLVINTMRDTMVPPHITNDTYTRLGGPKKYIEMDWGHFSLLPEFTEALVGHAHTWFQHHTRKG